MKSQPKSQYTVTEMQLEDIEPVTEMRLQSWLETYINEAAGVTREWIEEHNQKRLTQDAMEKRQERFLDGKARGTFNGWVAKDAEGTIIGSATATIDENGIRELGSLYVDKAWHGTGVAHELMRNVIDWLGGDKNEILLGVVTYNERAKAFYRKWGFEEVPGTDHLFDAKIPEIKMMRKVQS